MKLRTLPGLCGGLVMATALLGGTGMAAAGERPRVVELFTSQGCSSCPPADHLLSELALRPGYVVLSLPVDYWDYIGWKDTLASPLFTARQKAYARARGDGQVYTPQAVVDGVMHVVGSESGEIDDAAEMAFNHQGALSVPVTLTLTNGIISADVGASNSMQATKVASLWLFGVDHSRTVAIDRGENSGRTLTYTNVVRWIVKVGDWKGSAAHFQTSLPVKGEAVDGYVVLLQAGTVADPGAILGAAKEGGI